MDESHHPWHLLQVSDVLDIEFGSALGERVPLLAWEPKRYFVPFFPEKNTVRRIAVPPLEVRSFSLLRGYMRVPWRWVARTDATVTAQLARQSKDASQSPLICTVPYFAGVAERWPGPVVYWLTDLIAAYNGADSKLVHALDRRMCKAATLVCPNSERLAKYLVEVAGCDPARIQVLPNATRASNLLAEVPAGPAPLPADAADLKRPVAGVIGNLAGNMDWLLLRKLVGLTPWMDWLFVGPTSMPISNEEHSQARADMMQHPNARFVGPKPYGALAAYARSFHVAVLPYLRQEPTYSGSSTRFYEHLAACRPMIATRGFAELLSLEPLLRAVDSAEDAAEVLQTLHAKGFEDGFAQLRWAASRNGTWQVRAQTMQEALGKRWPG